MKIWYFAKDGQRLGPYSGEEFKALAMKGSLVATSLVWREGMKEWVPASQVKGLISTSSIPPPLPDQPFPNTYPSSIPGQSSSASVPPSQANQATSPYPVIAGATEEAKAYTLKERAKAIGIFLVLFIPAFGAVQYFKSDGLSLRRLTTNEAFDPTASPNERMQQAKDYLVGKWQGSGEMVAMKYVFDAKGTLREDSCALLGEVHERKWNTKTGRWFISEQRDFGGKIFFLISNDLDEDEIIALNRNGGIARSVALGYQELERKLEMDLTRGSDMACSAPGEK